MAQPTSLDWGVEPGPAFSSFQPEANISHAPASQHLLSPSFSLLPAPRLWSARLTERPQVRMCVPECTCACLGPAWATPLSPTLFLPQEQTPARPCPLALECLGPSPSLCPPPPGFAALVSSVSPSFSPLSLCPSSDLDRDFWNNNESTVQQKWSSYPPKEFILNISPYAPYGDPRLSLK